MKGDGGSAINRLMSMRAHGEHHVDTGRSTGAVHVFAALEPNGQMQIGQTLPFGHTMNSFFNTGGYFNSSLSFSAAMKGMAIAPIGIGSGNTFGGASVIGNKGKG